MGGGNRKGAEDVQRTTNTPNNFFGWFVGPAAIAYGKKNPGPARAPQLGDIVVMGGDAGGVTAEVKGGKSFPLPKGRPGTGPGQVFGASRDGGSRRHAGVDVVEKTPYGPDPKIPTVAYAGGKVLSERYQTTGYTSGLMVDHGGLQTRYVHVTPTVRPGQMVQPGQQVGRLLDLAGQTHLHFEAYQGSKLVNPTSMLNASAFGGENFGVSFKDNFMLKLHKGEMYKVFDKDSVSLFGYDLSKEIIDIENQAQLVARAPSIIERLKAISGYTDYEQPGGTQIIEVPVEVPVPMGGKGGGGSLMAFGGGEGGYDHASGLYER